MESLKAVTLGITLLFMAAASNASVLSLALKRSAQKQAAAKAATVVNARKIQGVKKKDSATSRQKADQTKKGFRGTIPKNVRDSFHQGKFVTGRINKPTTLYRYRNNDSWSRLSQGKFTYLSRDAYKSREMAREKLALTSGMRKRITHVDTYKLNPSHKISYIEGKTSAQAERLSNGATRVFTGQGNQVVIETKLLRNIQPYKHQTFGSFVRNEKTRRPVVPPK